MKHECFAAVSALALFVGVLCAIAPVSAAAPGDPPVPVAAASAGAAAVAQRRVSLTVTGSGKVIADAEVLFSAESIRDKKLYTDEEGLVTWTPPAIAKVQVRIIAAGWTTYHGEIALPPGPLPPQTIQLVQMPPAKQKQ